jgi:ABC-type bacteriocin/lantibiotic exporter with double-glycine peptidase domain
MLLLALVANTLCLTFLRVSGDSATTVQIMHNSGELEEEIVDEVNVPFKPVTLTFEDVCYDVKASTGKETLRLLHNVNGVFAAGRMCALMGSSGAGKTTLLVRFEKSPIILCLLCSKTCRCCQSRM